MASGFAAAVEIASLEKERDFYFGKLRDIEVLCQTNNEKNAIIDQILQILYATEVSKILIFVIHSVLIICLFCQSVLSSFLCLYFFLEPEVFFITIMFLILNG